MKFHFGTTTFPGVIKCMEEAGEFIQAATKLMGSRTWTKRWPLKRHERALREEATDLFATLHFLFAHNPQLLDSKRFEEKMAKYAQWHKEQANG